MIEGSSRYHASDGLTLLEVLAAFLIFSLVFTVLVGTSQSGVQSQGLSLRRLAANEVADLVVADLEIAMAQHELPLIEESEYSIDDYLVRIVETDFVGEENSGRGGISPDLNVDIAAMLGSQLPDVAKYAKRYDIQVEWIEANVPVTVDRTTFAFDWAAAQADVTGLFAAAGAGESGPSTIDDDPTSEDANERSGKSGDRNRTPSTPSKGDKARETEEILEKMRPYL